MKYTFLKITLLVFFVWRVHSLSAQNQSSLLWEVSGKGLSKPSYLFGTIHIICHDELEVPPEVITKFKTAKTLFLEIDMDDAGMMQDMMQGMQMKDSSIDQLLDPSTFDSISVIFQQKTGFPLSMMKKMKPLFLTSLLYPSMMDCQPESWEKKFQEMAGDQKMETKGFETLQDQLNAISNISYKEQAQQLAKALLNMDSMKLAFNKLMEVYKTKDVDQIYKFSEADEDFGLYEINLLNERNTKWIPVIEKAMMQMPAFFAFGAAHMGGKNGIISLLRKKGYHLKPIIY